MRENKCKKKTKNERVKTIVFGSFIHYFGIKIFQKLIKSNLIQFRSVGSFVKFVLNKPKTVTNTTVQGVPRKMTIARKIAIARKSSLIFEFICDI